MKHAIQTLEEHLEREMSMSLDDYIRILYEACESRPYCNEAANRLARDEVESSVEDLEFRRQDRVLCAANALCSEYVYAGFSAGFRRGVELCMEMAREGLSCF